MKPKTAAFFDLDGTLLRGNVITHYAYYAKTDPSLARRFGRLIELAAKGPYFFALDRIDRRMFNEVFYKSYAGLSQDRLAVLGQQLWDRALRHNLYPGARELIDGDRRRGHHLVLLTGALDFVADPIKRELGFDHYQASRLEYGKNGLATGELLPPVMAGPEKAAFVRQYCRENGFDIEQCVAYADDAADLPMLSTVGHPVAVNPDLRLATTARSHHWPVVRFDAGLSMTDKALGFAGDAWRTARHLAEDLTPEGPSAWEKPSELSTRARSAVSWLKDLARDARTVAEQAREAARNVREKRDE